MTALKCVLWRRPRNTRRHQSGTMSLVQTSHNERKCKIKSKQCLKRWCGGRKRHPGSERKMPCLEATSGSQVVPCSPEMPTLLPFTTEHEDPTSGVYQITCSTSPEKDGHQFVRVLRGGQKETYQPVVVLKRLPPLESCPQQEDDVPGSAFELEELRRREVLASPLGGGYSSTREEDDWLQWPEEYEGCSCEDLVDISPVSSFPEIDVIDGVEFFSFLQEEDMINYSRLHSRSWFFGDSSTPQDDSPTLSSEDFSEEKSGGLIFPTKTKDITQIKGWKRKLFAEDCKDFESASWTIRQKEEEESLDILEEKPAPACSAFTSSSLEDFLKTSSQLRISYLASYIPNVTPIPSDSPILSVGTLTKDFVTTRDQSPRADSIVQKTPNPSESNDLPFDTEPKNVTALETEEALTESNSICGPSTLREETVSPSADNPSRVENLADLQTEQNSPIVETLCEELLSNETKCHRSVIREPVFDSEEDQSRLSEFLSELRQPNVYAMFQARYEGPKTKMDCPTITDEIANTAAEALSRIVDRKIQKIHESSSVTTTGYAAATLDEAEKTPPEKRNKRMIRLPARFLDSAVIFPGCEGWVSPDLPNSRKRRRKSEVASCGDRLRSRNGKSKSGEARSESSKMEEEEVTILAEYETRQTSSKGNSDASRDLVQLKHLKDHDLVGVSVVRSLLIVHPSLRIRDTVAKSVSLPLAGIALPVDGRDSLVYLLYGSKDALLQNHCGALESSSLDDLLQSDSPVVPVLRNISSGVSLEKNPLSIKGVLESNVRSLSVYLVSSKTETCPPVVANGVLPFGAPSAASSTEIVLAEKLNGETELVSSLHVSRNKITVKSTFAGDETLYPKKCVPVPGENGPHLELRDDDDESEARLRVRRKAETTRRKDLRRQLRYLYNTLLSDSDKNEKNEKLSGIEILQKATEHIFGLCSKAKELEEERRLLRVTHNRLVESYATCLDDLPADCRKNAIDSLSRQIDEVAARKPDCLQQEKKRIAEDTEVQKVAKAAWSLVGPCSVRKVELRNGHTVYVYSSHAEEGKKAADKGEGDEKEDDSIVVVEEEEETATSLWVSDVGEPCFVTRLLPEEDENR